MKVTNLFRPLSALLAVVLFLTVNVAASEQQMLQRGCGTPPPSAELVEAHTKAHKGPPRIRGRATAANSTAAQPNSTSPLAVKVYFHVVSTEDQKGFVNMSMIYKQVCPFPPSPPFPPPSTTPRSHKQQHESSRMKKSPKTKRMDRMTDGAPTPFSSPPSPTPTTPTPSSSSTAAPPSPPTTPGPPTPTTPP